MSNDLSASISSAFKFIIGTKNKQTKIQNNRKRELVTNIEHAKAEMHQAMDNFNNVIEPKLIDFYIYKIQSEQTRFEQLISEYKELCNSSDDITP